MTPADVAEDRKIIACMEANIAAIAGQEWMEPDVKDDLIRELREVIGLAEAVIARETRP